LGVRVVANDALGLVHLVPGDIVNIKRATSPVTRVGRAQGQRKVGRVGCKGS
jgi:hypothetical protein